ncbi:MAG: hypothetical protein HQM10_23730 [Candidatus Riflebacteria bacterium]|nr:hypothetical protein [Candidatus Riflebacteria bacterium]
MADATKVPTSISSQPPADPPQPQEAQITPVEQLKADIQKLENLNIKSELLKRFRCGIHPDSEIERLIQTHINLNHNDYQGPFPVRVACTFAFIVVSCGTIWLILWICLSLLGAANFLKEISALMTILFIALLAFGLANPISLYNEVKLSEKIASTLNDLKQQI